MRPGRARNSATSEKVLRIICCDLTTISWALLSVVTTGTTIPARVSRSSTTSPVLIAEYGGGDPCPAALVMTAAMETFIGLTLVTGRGLRAGLAVLAGAMVGIMSPLVLFYGDLFPGGLPTIEGQYVLKDIVLAAAGAVVAARALGAQYVVSDGTAPGTPPAE